MEVEKEVKTYLVTLKCPDCEVQMEKDVEQKLPPYIYKCSRCGSTHNTYVIYPQVKYV